MAKNVSLSLSVSLPLELPPWTNCGGSWSFASMWTGGGGPQVDGLGGPVSDPLCHLTASTILGTAKTFFPCER